MTIASATTDLNGAWSAIVPVAAKAPLRAVYRGDVEHPAVVSPGLTALVPPQIALTATTQQAPPGTVILFTGSVTPTKPRVTIVIAGQQPDGTFIPIRNIRLRPADDGSFSRSIGFLDAGQFEVVVHTAADDANALGTSAPIAITIA